LLAEGVLLGSKAVERAREVDRLKRRHERRASSLRLRIEDHEIDEAVMV
jgi:hypothetical protein